MGELEITRAGPGDWPALALVRAQAENTMGNTGLYTRAQLDSGRDQLWLRFERGTMWIARDGGRAVGAIGLDGPDPRFWDDDPHGVHALYLYKVMAVPGRGTGPQLVAFAHERARLANRGLLRLDCLRDNPGLHAWWKAQGFRHVRTTVVAGYGAGALFEKEVLRTRASCAWTAPPTRGTAASATAACRRSSPTGQGGGYGSRSASSRSRKITDQEKEDDGQHHRGDQGRCRARRL